jgi:hypothetical protein
MSLFRFILVSFLITSCHFAKAGIFDSALVFKKIVPDFGIDGFNTVIRGHSVNFSGIKGGISWQEKYALGLSYYLIGSSVDERMLYQNQPVNARLHFGYFAIYTEYTFFTNDRWEFVAGMRPGIGRVYNAYTIGTEERKLGQSYFPLLTPYTEFTFRLVYWLGLTGGIGYRMVPVDGLSGPWIDFGAAIFFTPLYNRFIKPKLPFGKG